MRIPALPTRLARDGAPNQAGAAPTQAATISSPKPDTDRCVPAKVSSISFRLVHGMPFATRVMVDGHPVAEATGVVPKRHEPTQQDVAFSDLWTAW